MPNSIDIAYLAYDLRIKGEALKSVSIQSVTACSSFVGVLCQGDMGCLVRVARNGDAANKIGTSAVARLAKHYGIPFYVCAPSSTIDMSLASGAEIPIEQRAA